MAQFAQVLAEIGEFGRFQIQLMILMSIPNFLSPFYMFGQVFMVLDEAHYCSVAWVKNQTLNLSAAEQLALSVPLDAEGRPESCLMFRPPATNASLEDILSHRFNETQPCETSWHYPEDRPQSLLNEVRLAFYLSAHLFWSLCLTLYLTVAVSATLPVPAKLTIRMPVSPFATHLPLFSLCPLPVGPSTSLFSLYSLPAPLSVQFCLNFCLFPSPGLSFCLSA